MVDGTLLLAADATRLSTIAAALSDRYRVVTATTSEQLHRQLRTSRVDALVVEASLLGPAGVGTNLLTGVRGVTDGGTVTSPTTLPVVVLTDDPELGERTLSTPNTAYLPPEVAVSHPALLDRQVADLLGEAAEQRANSDRVPAALLAATRTLPSAAPERAAVEVKVHIETEDDPLCRLATVSGCRFRLEGFSPLGRERAEVAVSVLDGDPSRVTDTGSAVVLERDDTHADPWLRLELREMCVIASVAMAGGCLRGLTVAPGVAEPVVTLSEDASVRGFVESCRERYPEVELVTRRELESPDSVDPDGVLPGDLTPRQRQAVLAAYEGGYFEWPRETTGEELAEGLGITPPTFHQHLRRGLAEVLAAVTEGETESYPREKR